MQIRCYYCHKPFAIGKDAVTSALELIDAEGLTHYDAQCPHCRRINRISRDELQRAVPRKEREPQEGKSDGDNT